MEDVYQFFNYSLKISMSLDIFIHHFNDYIMLHFTFLQ